MKRIFFVILAIAPMGAIAAGPSTSCPAGYTAVVTDYITIADDACPSGHTSIGTATSCMYSNNPAQWNKPPRPVGAPLRRGEL